MNYDFQKFQHANYIFIENQDWTLTFHIPKVGIWGRENTTSEIYIHSPQNVENNQK